MARWCSASGVYFRLIYYLLELVSDDLTLFKRTPGTKMNEFASLEVFRIKFVSSHPKPALPGFAVCLVMDYVVEFDFVCFGGWFNLVFDGQGERC